MSGERPGPGTAGTKSDAVRIATLLPRLPSVDAVLEECRAQGLGSQWSRAALLAAARATIEELRTSLRAGTGGAGIDLSLQGVVEAVAARVREQARPRLRRVVNATGIVLHSNLGRARLARAAIDAAIEAAAGAVTLEYDLEAGERGHRDSLVEEHLCALTGAEAATVVNNNAAGVVLTLAALAAGREVLVSRGELVEIGGSFRVPEIMEASGARLVEVGTTNRTHLRDYEKAIGDATALVMKVHTSNYRIVGFAASVELRELAALCAKHPGLALVEDLGSGALLDPASLSEGRLATEPLLGERLAAGAGLVLASGDKLLGGPQCGIVAGRRDLVERLKKHPLKRALRCDKMTLAALEATLRLYRFSPDPAREIPTLRYLLRPVSELRPIGEEALRLLREHFGAGWSFELVDSAAEAGSGSQPTVSIPSLAVAVRSSSRSATQIERLFRSADPPILGRISNDCFLVDLRLIEDARELLPQGPAS